MEKKYSCLLILYKEQMLNYLDLSYKILEIYKKLIYGQMFAIYNNWKGRIN